jgi:hypothetical protein
VSRAKAQVTYDDPRRTSPFHLGGAAAEGFTRGAAASVPAQPYRRGTCGDTVGAARRGRGTPAQMRAGPWARECRMADWGTVREAITPAVKSTAMGPFARQVARPPIHPDT